MNFLLNASYPFYHPHYKRIYEKSDKFSNVFHCNICHLKLLGEKQLTEHNHSFKHQLEIEQLYVAFLDKSMKDRFVLVHCMRYAHIFSELFVIACDLGWHQASQLPNQAVRQKTWCGMQQSAHPKWNWTKNGQNWNANMISTNKIHARIQCTQKNGKFSTFELLLISLLVSIHHIRTIFIFICRIQIVKFDSNAFLALATANEDPNTYDFTTNWTNYWKQRIQVYYNQSQKKILEEIAANYEGMVFSSDSEPSSPAIQHEASRSTSSASTDADLFDITADKIYRKARTNGKSINWSLLLISLFGLILKHT